MQKSDKHRIVKELREWREKMARLEGVDFFRILGNQSLIDIAELSPKTKDKLLSIKGIKDKKFEKYGKAILAIVKGEGNEASSPLTEAPKKEENENDALSVSEYLDQVNEGLRDFEGRVQGEVGSLDIRGNYLFFTLKDKDAEAALSCFMWASAYKMSGVEMEEGLEVVVHGFPEVYKPSGRLSFKADFVELVGEGALKKAYEALKKKLAAEGLFAPERKRPLPDYPERIGLITSSTGAVIHDFLNNVGKFGFKITFVDSHVEGAQAVPDLLRALRVMKKQDIDILVMIRGGGSLESLAAFNNEMLVREVVNFSTPVLVGIGHDKDVPLLSFAADLAVSTPTAAAKILNADWEQALSKVRIAEGNIFSAFESTLREKNLTLVRSEGILLRALDQFISRARSIEDRFRGSVQNFKRILQLSRENISRQEKNMFESFERLAKKAKESLVYIEKMLAVHDPERVLRLGYSIALKEGKVLKSAKNVKNGEKIEVRLSDGTIHSTVNEINI